MGRSRGARLRRLAAVGAALACALVGLSVGGAVRSTAAGVDCTPDANLWNPCRPWFGASSNAYSQVSGAQNQYLYFEQREMRQMDMVHTYHAVGQSTADQLTDVDKYFINRPGTILYTNWALTKDFASADGSNAQVNAQIDKMANSIVAGVPAGKKIFMTLHHEPENDLSTVPSDCRFAPVGTMGTAADYVNMWHNVRNRFHNIPGADNRVVWVMNYMNYPKFDCMIDDVYPGDAYVDWISFNGYHSTNTNVSYQYEVGRFYDILTNQSTPEHDYASHPWGIVEWGIHSSTQQNAYLYYRQAKAATEQNVFPKLGFYMIFDNGDQNRNIYDFQVAYGSNRTYDPMEQAWWNTYANSWSITGDGTPDPGAPSTPSGLQVSTASGQPVVTWNDASDPDGIASYDVFRISATGSTPGGVPVKVGNAVSGTSFTDSSAPTGVSVYQVVAEDNTGARSELSAPVSSSGGGGGADTEAPSVPQGVTATLSNNVPVVSWTASTDNVGVTDYQVRRGTTVVGTVTSGTQFTDTGAPQGRTASYTVRARDAAGNASAYSTAASVFVRDTTAPTGPSSLTVTRTSGTQAALSWGAASDNVAVTGYWVYRGTTRIAQLGSSARSYTATGLTTGRTYTFQVRPRDAAGNLGTGASATG